MAFNGNEGEFIELAEACDMTANWRNGDNGDMKGYFFGKEKLLQLLDGESKGIRIYFGQETPNGEKTLVLVGAGENENDNLDLILDRGIGCPPRCGSGSGLNGGK